MCLPKPPKTDPAIKQQQIAQRRAEAERLAEEKKKNLVTTKKGLRQGGIRSLIGTDTSSVLGPGFGSNY